MKNRNRAVPAVIAMTLLLFFAGCAGKIGYGSHKLASLEGDTMTVETLAKNWKDYDVYYSGVDTRPPYGILFDVKGDNRKIVSKYWVKVEDEKTVSDMIQWMIPFYGYKARLFRITGADKQFYGYVYTPWTFVVFKQIDPDTLFAYDLKKMDRPIKGDI